MDDMAWGPYSPSKLAHLRSHIVTSELRSLFMWLRFLYIYNYMIMRTQYHSHTNIHHLNTFQKKRTQTHWTRVRSRDWENTRRDVVKYSNDGERARVSTQRSTQHPPHSRSHVVVVVVAVVVMLMLLWWWWLKLKRRRRPPARARSRVC